MKVTTLDAGLEESLNYVPKKPFYLLMPAYNEAGHLYFIETITKVTKLNGLEKLIVIDDGSTDSTAEKVRSLQQNHLIDLVRYQNNLGKEGAIRAGLVCLVNKGFIHDSWICLMDADGQHKIKDIRKMLYAAESTQADVVCGYRPLDDMPADRKFANWGTATILKVWGGFPIKDPLFGQKVFHAKYVNALTTDLTLNGGYRIELSLIYHLAKYGAKFYEIPVKAEYKECSGKSGMGLGLRNIGKPLKNTTYVFKVGTRIRNIMRLSKMF